MAPGILGFGLYVAISLIVDGALQPAPGEITFEQRIEAQRAIERVYYSHQIGATRPFEEAVPQALLETKVRTYLKQSVALERFWDRPVTGAMLRQEAERIARETKMPERLRELYAALGNDPELIQECLVRPVLVDRLARASSTSGPKADAIGLAPSLIPRCSGDSWVPLAGAPGGAGLVLWTGSLVLEWNGDDASGWRYDPALDAWSPISSRSVAQMPQTRGVWTGSEMIIWGGVGSLPDLLPYGARYDPVANTWRRISVTGSSEAVLGHAAVWDGHRMIIIGGYKYAREWVHDYPTSILPGRQYDPATDTWSAGPTFHRAWPSAVWSGSLLIAWAGSCIDGYNDPNPPACAAEDPRVGFVVDYVNGTSHPTTSVNAPTPRSGASVLWAGSAMVHWGGGTAAGERYDPVADAWTSLSAVGAPSARSAQVALWDGARMLVWGGQAAGTGTALNTGGRYDPATDTWSPITMLGAPAPASNPFAAWIGSSMVVWQAWSPQPGGRYLPDGSLDADGDGFRLCDGDCDDARSTVYPGAPEICDGRNNDCNDPSWPAPVAADIDQDGDGFRVCQNDCDDTRTWVYPGAPLLCDGVNNDCNDPTWPALTDEIDQDGDGFSGCQGDCDDAHASVYPAAPQICDGMNNNCAEPAWPSLAGTNEADDDGDALSECQGDCDDAHASVYPGAPQVCGDGLNNDCADASWPVPVTDRDLDFDGVRPCQGDCDDTRASVYPGAPQICDGLDNDCSDPAWPAVPPQETDADLDGVRPCAGDCDDAHASVYPGAPQVCDGLNNDCRTYNWPSLAGTNEADDDADGFTECQQDCNDDNAGYWQTPGEARGLVFSAGGVVLSWLPPLQPGCVAPGYDVIRVLNSPWDFVAQATCVESDDGSDTQATDAEEPYIGAAFYYVVRAQSGCGQGPGGVDSAGQPRPARSCP